MHGTSFSRNNVWPAPRRHRFSISGVSAIEICEEWSRKWSYESPRSNMTKARCLKRKSETARRMLKMSFWSVVEEAIIIKTNLKNFFRQVGSPKGVQKLFLNWTKLYICTAQGTEHCLLMFARWVGCATIQLAEVPALFRECFLSANEGKGGALRCCVPSDFSVKTL